MIPAHISMNPHFEKLPVAVQEIERYVFLEKEADYLLAKRRHLEETLLFSQEPARRIELINELRETEEQLQYTNSQYPRDLVKDLRQVCRSYMTLYRLSIEDLAKQSKLHSSVVGRFFKEDEMVDDTREFAIWAIQTFRLNANLYLRQLNHANKGMK